MQGRGPGQLDATSVLGWLPWGLQGVQCQHPAPVGRQRCPQALPPPAPVGTAGRGERCCNPGQGLQDLLPQEQGFLSFCKPMCCL